MTKTVKVIDPLLAHYTLAQGVKWVVETHGLILTDGKGKVWLLHYPEAAIWDLLMREYPMDKVFSMMTYIASINSEEARNLVLNALNNWTQEGLMVKEVRHG
ncbi:MAG: hypothetical protein R2724_34580 [Bryobacterales bacterium]